MRRQDSLRYVAESLAVLLLYYLAGKAGLTLAYLHPTASPVWPASGIALAALVLLGTPCWPAIFLGAFLVNVTTAEPVTTSLAIACGNTVEAVLGALLVTRYAGGRRAFDRPADVLRFVLLAPVLSTVAAATIGVTSLAASGRIAWGAYGPIWLTWWLGDALGDLVAAPVLLLWLEDVRPRWHGRLLESALLVGCVLGIGDLVFFHRLRLDPGHFALGYLCVLPLLWAALRFGTREVAGASLLLSVVAIWGTVKDAGPFAGARPNDALLLLQALLGVLIVVSITVAAHVEEARRIGRELLTARQDLERKVEERTREISEANAELRKSEAKFRDLLESAPDGMVIMDRAGRIELVNARTERMFRYAREDLLGRDVEILFPERYRSKQAEERQGTIETPRLKLMGAGVELWGLRRDGSEFPVDISLSPLKTEKGPLVSAAIRDITRRRQYEESAARLAAVVASSDDAIVSTDLDGVITTWNAAAERLCGYTAAEVIGRSSAFLSAPGRAGEMERTIERLKRQRHVRYETQVMRKNGAAVDVGLTAFPVVDRGGRVIGFSTILRDITEQKRAELARQEKEVLESQVSDLSRHTHEISVLSELGEVLRAAVRTSEAYPVIPRFLRDLFPSEAGAFYEHDETHDLFGAVLSWGEAPPPDDAFFPSECWALRRGQMHPSGEAGEMVCQHVKPPVYPGALCIPLMARGRTLGLLHLRGDPAGSTRPTEGSPRVEYRMRLAKTVAQQISSALFDLKLQETLRDQASRDPLTGLFNRRYMEETLHREMYRAARRKAQLGFLLFDIDHFKRFNDQHGHAAGDVALREVGAFVQRHTRGEDIVCRYGGEEFLLVLSDCSSRHLTRRAEEIREGVKSLRLEYDQRPLRPITLSVGVALYPDHGKDLMDLFQAADAALYQAKKAGRDQVVMADPARWIIVPPGSSEKESQH